MLTYVCPRIGTPIKLAITQELIDVMAVDDPQPGENQKAVVNKLQALLDNDTTSITVFWAEDVWLLAARHGELLPVIVAGADDDVSVWSSQLSNGRDPEVLLPARFLNLETIEVTRLYDGSMTCTIEADDFAESDDKWVIIGPDHLEEITAQASPNRKAWLMLDDGPNHTRVPTLVQTFDPDYTRSLGYEVVQATLNINALPATKDKQTS